MAEITLDDNKIAIPNRLKVSTFLSELQKKTKQQYLYLINDKEVGVFQSLNEAKKGMWRKYKPSDEICHYYIDPDTMNEYTVFSEELSKKIGSFPYEGPTHPTPIRGNTNHFQTNQNTSFQATQTSQPSFVISNDNLKSLTNHPNLQNLFTNTNLQPPISSQTF
jgi:hypothetical protein